MNAPPPAKYLFCLLLLTGLLIPRLTAQETLSDSSWIADLRFLQRTVHEDYPFLFKKTTAAEFDDRIEGLIGSLGGLRPHEIRVGLARIVSSFRYGHTSVNLFGAGSDFARLPLNLYRFSDGVFVEGVHRDHARALGARVVEVEGVPVERALEAIRPVVPAENEQYFRGYGLNYLTSPAILHAQRVMAYPSDEVRLTLERDGATFDVTVPLAPRREVPTSYGFTQAGDDWLTMRATDTTPRYLDRLDRHYYVTYLPADGAVYVRYSQVVPDSTEGIPEFFDRVFALIEEKGAGTLVLDLRLNGGGNNFNNRAVVRRIIQAEEIDRVGNLFVLIGRRTFSAAQNLVNELDNYTNAVFVGEPTAENVNFYGDNRVVELPNSKIPVRLSWAWWQDKPAWRDAPWTAPHVAAELRSEDYRENRDPVLVAALNFRADNFLLDPMQHLTELFQAGKIREVEREAMRIVADSTYRFFDLGGELERTGNMLLGNGRTPEALYVLGMNARLYTESASAHLALAEAYRKVGDTDKAAEGYRRVVELDPEGTHGERARLRLKE